MSDTTEGWLILRADLTPDWGAFSTYWMRERSQAERLSRQAGIEAFEAQQAAAHVLLEAAWAEQALGRAIRKAEMRAERRAASIERRRRYNAVWMRECRAKEGGVGTLRRPGSSRGNLRFISRF
jgi:hypothetical protein